MNSQKKDELKNIKKVFDVLGIRYIDARDKKIISYVSEILNTINTGTVVSCGTVSYSKAISDSLDNLKVLGMEPYIRVSKFISTIPFLPVYSIRNGYSCHIAYSCDDNSMVVDRNSGIVKHYKVPQKPDVMASFYLGHEHIHALKETNYDEYIDGQIFGDVIPIFYELLMGDNFKGLQKEIFKFRISSLKEDKVCYDNALLKMNKKDDKDLYKVIATRSGQYLNSFYYAVLLYNLYKRSPKMILELVNNVLRHEITTREMLEQLGIIYEKCDEFESEIGEIRKILR